MKYAMCNIHINDYYSKYFVYNDSNFILFHCDFTNNLGLLFDITLATLFYGFEWRHNTQKTWAVYRRESRVRRNVSIHMFRMSVTFVLNIELMLSMHLFRELKSICRFLPYINQHMTGVMRKGPLSFDVTILRKRRQSLSRSPFLTLHRFISISCIRSLHVNRNQ